MYIFAIIYAIISSPLLAAQMKPKLCIDCKFYKKDFFTTSEFGKCTLFPRKTENDNFLVNGMNVNNNIDYLYCSISRKYEDMCGKEGKFYEKKRNWIGKGDKV
jgi:hypothetical protein